MKLKKEVLPARTRLSDHDVLEIQRLDIASRRRDKTVFYIVIITSALVSTLYSIVTLF